MPLYQDRYRVESTRLRGWDYRTPGWYFVTICVRDRTCILGEILDGRAQLSTAGQIADSELRSLPGHYANVSLDSFIVMPNHVHATVVIGGRHLYSPNSEIRIEPAPGANRVLIPPKAGSLSAIVRSYKAGVTRRCHQLGLLDFAWQSGFYEHVVRADASLNAIRDYIEKTLPTGRTTARTPLEITCRDIACNVLPEPGGVPASRRDRGQETSGRRERRSGATSLQGVGASFLAIPVGHRKDVYR